MGFVKRAAARYDTVLRRQRATLGADAMAGMTFAVVNIPQAMANALLAGVNPVLGLYTLMIATPVGALFTSSVYMNVSTTSALSVAAGDALLGVPGPAKMPNLVLLVLWVGIFQLLAGLFRLGSLLRFVSRSVMVGFISGVAALIVLGQVEDFTGYDSFFNNKVLRLADVLIHWDQLDWQTLTLSLLTVALIVGLGYTRLQKISMLIALMVTTLVAYLAAPAGIAYVGDIAVMPEQLLDFALPRFLFSPTLVTSALAIAIVGLVQGAGVSQSYANPDGTYPKPSRDFLGQGVANIATSFFQGIPAGGSMSGTALTVSAGARTRLANIFAGLFVMPLVWLFGDVVNLIPMAALAALLVVVGAQSVRPHDIRRVWQTGKLPATAMALTFVATLLLPIQYAVFVGVAVSVLLHVFQSSNRVHLVRWIPVDGGFPIEVEPPRQLSGNEITLLYAYGSLFFAAAANVEKLLPAVGNAKRPVVIIVARGLDEMGSTLIGVLERYGDTLHQQGGRLMLAGVGDNVHAQLVRTGMVKFLGEENIFREQQQLGLAVNDALRTARDWLAAEAARESG